MRESGATRRRSASVAAVDVHCHVFNSWDVPVRRFVELVYLEKYPGAVLATPLIDLIELIMRSGAPTTGDEIAYLKQSGLRVKNLKRIRTQAHDINAVSRALALMWVASPKDRRWVRPRLSPRVRRRLKGKRNIVMSPRDFRETAQHLVRTATGDLATWIKFALIYTRWRWEITRDLTKVEGPKSRGQGRTDILERTMLILLIENFKLIVLFVRICARFSWQRWAASNCSGAG